MVTCTIIYTYTPWIIDFNKYFKVKIQYYTKLYYSSIF